MNKMFYLLNVGISGVKSIKKEVKLNFYKKTIDKEFNPEKYRIKAIYGENGSGKSALITAINIFRDLIINEHYLIESKTQIFLDEIISKATRTFKFNCEFLTEVSSGDKLIYYYAFEIGQGNTGSYVLKHEILRVRNGNYPNSKYSTIFECENGELIQLDCENELREKIEKKTINLLAMNSFVYLYMVNCVKEKEPLNDLIRHILSFVIFTAMLKIYIVEEDQHELYFFRKRLKENSFNETLPIDGWKELINGLNELSSVNEKIVHKSNYEKYREKVEQLTSFIKIFKKDLVSIDIEAKENGENYECELNLNYGEYSINKEFESTGIKKLIRLFDCFVAASRGGIVFIDEMDSNLNDVYLCKLIEYFMYYGEGQLCFTTHNLDPMTILKDNKNSIDFLSSDNHLVSWVSRGNATPDNCYKNGMIEDSPFNIEAADFVGLFGE